MSAALVIVAILVCCTLCFYAGDNNGFIRGVRISEKEMERLVKLGYEAGVKDSKQYVADTLAKAYDTIEAELNKKGLTIKNDPKKMSDKDKKIEEALKKQRQRLEQPQAPKQLPQLSKLTKPHALRMVKNESDNGK